MPAIEATSERSSIALLIAGRMENDVEDMQEHRFEIILGNLGDGTRLVRCAAW